MNSVKWETTCRLSNSATGHFLSVRWDSLGSRRVKHVRQELGAWQELHRTLSVSVVTLVIFRLLLPRNAPHAPQAPRFRRLERPVRIVLLGSMVSSQVQLCVTIAGLARSPQLSE